VGQHTHQVAGELEISGEELAIRLIKVTTYLVHYDYRKTGGTEGTEKGSPSTPLPQSPPVHFPKLLDEAK
jgi:hypothetical protein